jgi:hypothetical protein
MQALLHPPSRSLLIGTEKSSKATGFRAIYDNRNLKALFLALPYAGASGAVTLNSEIDTVPMV